MGRGVELKNLKHNPPSPALFMIPHFKGLEKKKPNENIMTIVFKMAGKIRPEALQRIIQLSGVPYTFYSVTISFRFVF